MGVPFVTVVTLRICDEERVISICGVLGTGWYVMHIFPHLVDPVELCCSEQFLLGPILTSSLSNL